MTFHKIFASIFIGIFIAACSSTVRDGEPTSAPRNNNAVTMVINARVYTLDPKLPWAESFAYNSVGKIIAVGTEADVREAVGGDPKLIDARNNMVMPGFQDPHVHIPEAGINETLCILPPDEPLDAYEQLAADCAEDQPDSEWVRAAGVSLFNFRTGQSELPIEVLDRAIPDRPAIILDDLGHSAWTNTLGMKAAGIGLDDPDPQGGVLYRDPTSGRFTGLLLESAQQRVRNAAALTDEENYEGLLLALQEAAHNGITTVSDAGGFWGQHHPEAWQRALRENKLTARGVNALYLYPDLDFDTQLAEFEERFTDDDGSLLQFDTAKIYVDGILDLGTASMLEPYDNPPDPLLPQGFNYFTREQLLKYVNDLSTLGYRMHFHVIGDAATRSALDAVEAIDAPAGDVASRRHRTTHTYLVDDADIARFKALGVVADFQKGPDSTDTAYHEDLSEIIGDRAFDLIPTKKLLDAGAHVSLSSDWDADPLSPFGTIQRAVNREANAVADVETAIRLVTLDAAFALDQDRVTGSIAVGKYADFIVIDQNLLTIDSNDIENTQVLLTFLAGREVYSSGEL